MIPTPERLKQMGYMRYNDCIHSFKDYMDMNQDQILNEDILNAAIFQATLNKVMQVPLENSTRLWLMDLYKAYLSYWELEDPDMKIFDDITVRQKKYFLELAATHCILCGFKLANNSSTRQLRSENEFIDIYFEDKDDQGEN